MVTSTFIGWNLIARIAGSVRRRDSKSIRHSKRTSKGKNSSNNNSNDDRESESKTEALLRMKKHELLDKEEWFGSLDSNSEHIQCNLKVAVHLYYRLISSKISLYRFLFF